jgi:lipoprotein-anchoring transpeptidase ErfK/SrfK
MSSDQLTAKKAMKEAFIALHEGKKQAARSLAYRAVKLAPELEEPWLILAAVAEPRASLEYLKEAFKINPGSFRARHGLLAVQSRLEQIKKASNQSPQSGIQSRQEHGTSARRGTTGILPQPADSSQGISIRSPASASPKKSGHSWLSWTGLFSVCGLALVTIMAMTLPAHQTSRAQAHELSAEVQKTIVLRQMATSTATATVTLPSPTLTNTPLPTGTPLPTSTITPEPSNPSSTPISSTRTDEGTFLLHNPVTPAGTDGAAGEKRIIVYLSQQHMYAYQGNELVYSFVVSTGANNGTRIGTFSILDKIPNAWSDPWGFWMPDWMGIYWSGYTENGIHALPVLTNGNIIWGNALGTPISHGCIVLSTQEAHLLYEWAEVGTQVQILK